MSPSSSSDACDAYPCLVWVLESDARYKDTYLGGFGVPWLLIHPLISTSFGARVTHHVSHSGRGIGVRRYLHHPYALPQLQQCRGELFGRCVSSSLPSSHSYADIDHS